MLLLMYS